MSILQISSFPPEMPGWVKELQEACCAELHAVSEETATVTARRALLAEVGDELLKRVCPKRSNSRG